MNPTPTKLTSYRDNAYVEKPKVMSLSFNKETFKEKLVAAFEILVIFTLGGVALSLVVLILALFYMTSPLLCGILLGILALVFGIPAVMAVERKEKEQ